MRTRSNARPTIHLVALRILAGVGAGRPMTWAGVSRGLDHVLGQSTREASYGSTLAGLISMGLIRSYQQDNRSPVRYGPTPLGLRMLDLTFPKSFPSLSAAA